MNRSVRPKPLPKTRTSETGSEIFSALKKAGLIGCFSGDGISATKEVVHKRIAAHFDAKLDARKR